jgi:hypothetical protein
MLVLDISYFTVRDVFSDVITDKLQFGSVEGNAKIPLVFLFRGRFLP